MEATQNKDITALVKPLPTLPIVISQSGLELLKQDIAIASNEVSELSKQLNEWVDNLVITNTEQAQDAGKQWTFMKNKIKEVEAEMEPQVAEALLYHRTLTGFRGLNTTMWQAGVDKLGKKIKTFQDEEARKAREEAAKIQAELDKQAAEARRIAEEKARREAEDKRIAEAQAAEAAGATQEAVTEILSADVIPEPVYVPQIQAIVMPKEPAKIEGMNTRKTYKAEVVDIKALLAAVAAGKVPVEAIKVDQSFLDKMAKAMPETLAYPGVKVVEVETFVKGR